MLKFQLKTDTLEITNEESMSLLREAYEKTLRELKTQNETQRELTGNIKKLKHTLTEIETRLLHLEGVAKTTDSCSDRTFDDTYETLKSGNDIKLHEN